MMRVLIVGLLAAGLSGCASTNAAQLAAAEDAVHDALASVDNGVQKYCSAPASDTIRTVCVDIRPSLIEALKVGAAFNQSVADKKIEHVNEMVAAAGRLAEQVKKLPGSESVKLGLEIARVVAEMYRLLGGKVGVGAVSGKPVAAFDYQPALQVPAH